MAEYTVKQIDEMEAIVAGAFKRARAELGVGSFGMAVIDMPPNVTQYPEHDHTHDGQEEVFVTLSGSGEIELDGEVRPLDPETVVRVGPEVTRKLVTRDESIRVLVLGGTPGEAYEAPDFSQLGAPDPLEQQQAAS